MNLLAPLGDERCGASALAAAHEQAARAGCALRRVDGTDEHLAAWIDQHFAPSWWSSEVSAGSAWIAERNGGIAGFAAFGARGLRFPWLRSYRERPEVGIFGPYGVDPGQRTSGVGEPLLAAALCSLRAAGYAGALIPAVSGEALIAMYVRRTGATIVDEFTYDVGRARATILASGAGSNARHVLAGARDGRLPLDVGAVLANRTDAGALTAAREFGVGGVSIVWERERESRAAFDARTIEALAATEPELVLLLGWMHVLPPAFLTRFPQTVNLHPAFLPLDPASDTVVAPDGVRIPALRGAHPLRDALSGGVPWVGATVHYVTAETDRGDVLVRVPLAVDGLRDEDLLRERVRPVEFGAVDAAVRRWSLERA